jgi:nucleoside-diphosphate-sugar epimerase
MSTENSNTLVLVTGAGGYIAAHVVKLLLDNGYQVRGTVRNVRDEKKVAPLKQLSTKDDRNLQLVEADLMKPETWPRAVEGCKYVIHMASPAVLEEPKHPDDLLKPAIEGTLNVLRACADNGHVNRVVLTSSMVSIFGDLTKKGVYDENDWTDTNSKVNTYAKSKTFAEKAAWDFVNETKAFELAVVNPGFVIGPLLHNSDCSSAEVITKLMEHTMPMTAKFMFTVIDVRDVALGHLKAMTTPEAAGKRHMLVQSIVWMKEMAAILDNEFKSQGYKLPMTEAPMFVLKMVSLFDKSAKAIVPDQGKEYQVDTSRMRNVLRITPIDVRTSLVDMAYSLIERGFVKKTRKYTPRE